MVDGTGSPDPASFSWGRTAATVAAIGAQVRFGDVKAALTLV